MSRSTEDFLPKIWTSGRKKGFFLIKTQDCRFETSRVRRGIFSIMHWIWISHLFFYQFVRCTPTKTFSNWEKHKKFGSVNFRKDDSPKLLHHWQVLENKIFTLTPEIDSTRLFHHYSDPYKWIQDATMLMKFASTYRWYKKVDSTHLLLRKRPGQEFSGRITCNRISLNFYSNWNQSHGKKCYLLN